ncbi:MAG: L-threonine 3-dehydrogenase [Oceanicaulis sp.]|uniref:L-threonine 3-dehydrogenase n=1 Tax=unclassified Oceanicaulis TaxID=2632123 RepID=UPI000066D4AD|nr:MULTISPECIES: L-threonine 3-dehydrogenase [unclassified Oceanicaulis]EAP90854.1 L-threonine 3-dehydrogenase [Oceanicaulis sp. HTCC2633]MAB69200.1 L-threonine 3-dehydrogenase [Oceanicaulis sp.]MBC38456.1 L-threonine 3-dehydrogenase [Oceanicaulis sp.]MBG35455.1 L-threonine 3-dehydrogenase [Oceanicaulis sp.]HBU62083.1 L-threonine 3-dehydrogenase [Oceanicaulis sp.]|tara:strand:- start:2028 stop:3062 length:1035 start_codon:yes stop_codon:yes gene_type:complete
MKALVKAKAEEGLWLQEVDKPVVGPDDVLIRVHNTAICGTDVHIYNWDSWAQKNVPVPMVVGHEFGGVIEEVGADVTRVSPGMRVSGEGHVVGQKSRAVRAGRFHLDPDTKGIGVNMPGAFAEYLVIPAFNVVPLPDEVAMEQAAFLDPLGNAVHTATAFDLVGEDVLITGAGPIGIMAAAVARHCGARHIAVTDINPDRLALLEKVCPTAVPVNTTKDDLKDVRARLKMTEGFDVGLEMSGAEPAFTQMVENMVMGGKIAMLGLPGKPFNLDMGSLIMRAITFKGIYGREMFETWHKMLAMLQSGLDVSQLITHRLPATDFQTGFDAMRSGKAGKVILDWTQV